MNKHNNNNSEIWAAIADNYYVEREEISFPSLLVDDVMLQLLASSKSDNAVLDYGAGSGTLSRLVYDKLGSKVIAYEPMKEMMSVLNRLTPSTRYEHLYPVSSHTEIFNSTEKIDTIICVNVFDHILDIPKTMEFFNSLLPVGGRLILCIPHPLKNIGNWVKREVDGKWEYLYYRLDGYLEEGEIKRNREDIKGNLIIKDVVSQHRTISTYYNDIYKGGFDVVEMFEPKPDKASEAELPILYTQSIRIPYFWILDCKKR